MSLVLRSISNVGDALTAPDGTILSNIEVSFLLVDIDGVITDVWDTMSGERIAPIKETVVTSGLGEFTVSLWPNDRGSFPTYYRCTVKSRNVRSFTAALPSGETTLKWIDFAEQNVPISSDLDLFERIANKATPNGYASLDATGKIPLVQLPAGNGLIPLAEEVAFTPPTDMTSTNVQAAIEELDGRDFIRAVTGEKLQPSIDGDNIIWTVIA